MRIWSKVLIPVLPTKQLKSMRYELGDMIKQHPNIKHPLVKFANNYDIGYLGNYFCQVCDEMDERGINHKISYDGEILNIVRDNSKYGAYDKYADISLQFNEDNETYLHVCGWNLYEKHLRGMIPEEEWKRLEEVLK
jgi:uncharacterized protein (TIGR02328 family)